MFCVYCQFSFLAFVGRTTCFDDGQYRPEVLSSKGLDDGSYKPDNLGAYVGLASNGVVRAQNRFGASGNDRRGSNSNSRFGVGNSNSLSPNSNGNGIRNAATTGAGRSGQQNKLNPQKDIGKQNRFGQPSKFDQQIRFGQPNNSGTQNNFVQQNNFSRPSNSLQPNSFGPQNSSNSPPRTGGRPNKEIKTLKESQEQNENGYKYEFETANNIKSQEQGRLDDDGANSKILRVEGSYQYTGDDGQTYRVDYTADENGFRPRVIKHLN